MPRGLRSGHGSRTVAVVTIDRADMLPPALAEALLEFDRHLRLERNLSEHTIRAYVGDLTDLLAHCAAAGVCDVGGLDVHVVRAWLARQHLHGKSRATLARRTAAAR